MTVNLAVIVLAISTGAALGALARYGLSLTLNGLMPQMPLGTLASNLIAAYIIGAAMAWFAANPDISPAWRLFIVTGLTGGLSTFSTFSAELFTLLREDRLMWSAGLIVTHVAGSLVFILLGMGTVALLRHVQS